MRGICFLCFRKRGVFVRGDVSKHGMLFDLNLEPSGSIKPTVLNFPSPRITILPLIYANRWPRRWFLVPQPAMLLVGIQWRRIMLLSWNLGLEPRLGGATKSDLFDPPSGSRLPHLPPKLMSPRIFHAKWWPSWRCRLQIVQRYFTR